MLHRLTLLLLAASLLSGADITSLRPVYTPETVIAEPGLVGLWTRNGSVEFRIAPDHDNGYHVIMEGQRVLGVRLVRIGNDIVADVTFTGMLPLHMIARLRLVGDELKVDWLGSEELEKRIRRPGGPKHEEVDIAGENMIVLTGSTPEFQRFILESLADPEAFGNHDTFERASPAQRAKDLNEQSWGVVRERGSRDDYRAAVELVEEAVKLDPDEPDYWNTLALGRLRARPFNDALAAVVRAESLRSEPNPEDLAVRAMILHRLGVTVEARAWLERLRVMLGDHKHCENPDVLLLLRQAEEILPRARPR